MKKNVHQITGRVWLVGGICLLVWAIPALIINSGGWPIVPYSVLAMLGGYSLLRGHHWARWLLLSLAILLGVFSLAFFLTWGVGKHGAEDWKALLALMFSALTVASLVLPSKHVKTSEPSGGCPPPLQS
jgi:hypothetical protein